MPCLFLLLILLFPRVVLVVLFLFTDFLTKAYHDTILVPLLGFLFLPVTTLVYAWMVNSGIATTGANLLWLILAVLVDIGAVGHGYSRRSR
jgi:hypothetical protein